MAKDKGKKNGKKDKQKQLIEPEPGIISSVLR